MLQMYIVQYSHFDIVVVAVSMETMVNHWLINSELFDDRAH